MTPYDLWILDSHPRQGTAWASLNRSVLWYTLLRPLHVCVPWHIHHSPIARLDFSRPLVEEGGLKRLGNLLLGIPRTLVEEGSGYP